MKPGQYPVYFCSLYRLKPNGQQQLEGIQYKFSFYIPVNFWRWLWCCKWILYTLPWSRKFTDLPCFVLLLFHGLKSAPEFHFRLDRRISKMNSRFAACIVVTESISSCTYMLGKHSFAIIKHCKKMNLIPSMCGFLKSADRSLCETRCWADEPLVWSSTILLVSIWSVGPIY